MFKNILFFFTGRGHIFLKNPSIGWSENDFWEGNLLRGKLAYGIPPPFPSPPPLPTYAPRSSMIRTQLDMEGHLPELKDLGQS